MRLGSKLLAAPLLTAAVVLGVATLNTLLMSREAVGNQAAFRARLGAVRTLASAQDQAGQIHAGVYRTLALIAALDDSKLKAYRASLTNQIAGVKRTIAEVAKGAPADPALQDALQQASAQIDSYQVQAARAIELSALKPNNGATALQTADSTFAALGNAATE